MVEKALSTVDILIDLKEITCEVSIKENTGFIGDLHWSAEAVGNVIKNCVEPCLKGESWKSMETKIRSIQNF